jgi:O-antigen/teichoic acid export membrane protein
VVRVRARLTSIVRDTGWTGASEVVNLATGFIVLNVLIRTLGPIGYGRYVAVAALAAILVTLSSTWVVMVLLQQGIQERRGLRQAHGDSLSLASCAAVLAFAAGLVLGKLLLPDLGVRVVGAFVGGELLAGVLIQVSAAAVQVAEGLPAATRLRLLQTVARFSVVLVLALAGRFELHALGAGLLLTYGVVGTAVHLRTTRRLGLRVWPPAPSRSGLRAGAPYAGVLVALAIQEDSDKILLVRFADGADAGLYAAAYRLVQLGFLPIRALIGSSHPRFLLDTPGVKREHLDRTWRYTRPAVLYSIVAAIGIAVTAPVVPAFFGSEYEGTLPLLVALSPLVVLRSISLFPLNALMGLKRYGTRFAVIASAAAINVALNVVLIPALSIWGAVLSTAVTEVYFCIVVWVCLVRAQRSHDLRQDEAPSDAVAAGAATDALDGGT